jgi:dihydrolipoamide dehydrogenase
MSYDFDVVFIGGGPGGYVGAIKAAKLGLKTACIEKRKTLGGTCLNVGCIPSKSLLEITHKYEAVKNMISSGLAKGSIDIDFDQMMTKKDKIISTLASGIDGLFAKNKVKRFIGLGKIISKNNIEILSEDGKIENITAKNIVISTGSQVTQIPTIAIDEQSVVSSTGALSLKKTPKTMIVIGAGVIGLELGSVYARLGTKVEVIEFLDRTTPSMDLELSREFEKVMVSQGISFKFSTKVLGVKKVGDLCEVEIESVKDAQKTTLKAEIVLCAIGRKPFTDGLGLESLGVKKNDRGFIEVDKHFKTNIDGIYAIGDVIPGPMLAHKSEEEGVAVAEILAGKYGHVNYDCIPSVIYTHPEVASVGKTEEELKSANIEYKVGKFKFIANSRAKAIADEDGFVKILACKKTDKILGSHIIGRSAGDIIHEICVAMEFGGSAEDIARTCHAHPTLNEAIKEACMAVDKNQIHS